MLNLVLRPVLARWHPALDEWENGHDLRDRSPAEKHGEGVLRAGELREALEQDAEQC